MGRACSTNGGEEEWILDRWERQKERPVSRCRHWREGYIEIDIGEIVWAGMDWIDLAQGRDQWRAFVNTIIILRMP
jgi:hypothetical protein